jgi:hypothetical protein
MSIEMTPKPRRELILDAVSDLATDPLNYDQEEDEYLPRGAIGEDLRGRRASTGLAHFEAGETTPEEIASRIGTPRLTRCEIEFPLRNLTVDLLLTIGVRSAR